MTLRFHGRAKKSQNDLNNVFTTVYASHVSLSHPLLWKPTMLPPQHPEVYHDLLEVFSITKAYYPTDPMTEPLSCILVSCLHRVRLTLSHTEQQTMNDYDQEALQQGFFLPINLSRLSSLILFWSKKEEDTIPA